MLRRYTLHLRTPEEDVMGKIGLITTGAGLLALGTVLGIGSYARFGHSTADASMPSTAPVNQALLSPNAPETPATDVPPILKQQLNQPQADMQLRSQQAVYAPVAHETLAPERTVTTTTTRTAYVPMTTTYHRAYIYQRVRNEAPGNIHVVRAMKHTLAFAVKFPFRLRF